MSTPPDAMGVTEVSRAKFRVDVRPKGSPCRPAVGSNCARYNTVTEELANPDFLPLGVTRCQPGGGFTAGPETVNPGNVLNQLQIYIDGDSTLSALTAAEKAELSDRLSDRVMGCVVQHEQEHVKFYSNPSNGVADACDNCCCDRVPGFSKKKVVDCSEAKAWEESKKCYLKLRNETSVPEEKQLLELAAFFADKTAADYAKDCVASP